MLQESNFNLTTPILFLVFSRSDTTKRVFAEIRKAKPTQLFIAADGPRNPEEKKKTDAVRDYIMKNINWKCDIKTLFRDKNLGCKYAVSSAITWFFNNVEQGIILEDDCLPSQSFFRFCEEMLERYKDDERIMHISGTNVMGKTPIKESYFFSNRITVWGWATWRRAWKKYDIKMTQWPHFKKDLDNLPISYIAKLKIKRIGDLTYQGMIDTWDYQWGLSIEVNNGLCMIPQKNLITNIGFGGNATHTESNFNKSLKRYNLKFPLVENSYFVNNYLYFKNFNSFFSKGQLKRFVANKIRNILKNGKRKNSNNNS